MLLGVSVCFRGTDPTSCWFELRKAAFVGWKKSSCEFDGRENSCFLWPSCLLICSWGSFECLCIGITATARIGTYAFGTWVATGGLVICGFSTEARACLKHPVGHLASSFPLGGGGSRGARITSRATSAVDLQSLLMFDFVGFAPSSANELVAVRQLECFAVQWAMVGRVVSGLEWIEGRLKRLIQGKLSWSEGVNCSHLACCTHRLSCEQVEMKV